MKKENLSDNLKQYIYSIEENKNPYFFSRINLANYYLETIKFDTLNSIVLFDSRRKGKTTFLINDVANLASEKYFVFYHSFLKDFSKQNECQNIVEDFFQQFLAFCQKTILGNDNEKIKNLEKSMEVEISLPFIKTKFKLGNNKNAGESKKISDLFELIELVKLFTDKPILLLLDEIQEISRLSDVKIGLGFLKNLRTILDLNKNLLKVFFTGSSYNGLMKMFSDYSQPFYKFGVYDKLNELDEDFIKHCLTVFQEENQELLEKHNIKIPLNVAMKIFDKQNRLPYEFINLLFKYALKLNFIKNENDKIKDFYYFYKNNIELPNHSIEHEYNLLSLEEKEILKQIILNPNKITSNNRLEELNFVLKSLKQENYKELTVENLRKILKKMKDKDLIIKIPQTQKWKILNYELENYVGQLL